MKLPGERAHEGLRNFPPPEEWDSFTAYDAKAHPRKVAREFMLIPTTCFNCESACGLLARRQGRPDDHQARGQPGPPRLTWPQLRQGSRHAQSNPGPRTHSLSTQTGGGAWRRALAPNHLG